MNLLIISGGQTGADLAGWEAAKIAGFETAGWMPHRFVNESGPHPEYADMYGAEEVLSSNPVLRTNMNVEWADATLWLGGTHSRGYVATERAAIKYDRDMLVVADLNDRALDAIVDFVREARIATLNIAGHRESVAPGIGARARDFLVRLFARLKEADPVD